jgi:cyanophycinase
MKMSNIVRNYLAIITLILSCIALTQLPAQEFDESFDHWPIDFKIKGKIIVANELSNRDEVDAYFLRASGGEKANIVGIVIKKLSEDEKVKLEKTFESAARLRLMFVDRTSHPIQKQAFAGLKEATGLMLLTDRPLYLKEKEAIFSVRDDLRDLIDRGGVLYASGPVAKLLSRIEITGGEHLADISEGLNLVPDSVIETDFSTDIDKLRVKSVLASHPRSVAIGLEPSTAVVLDGRILRVLGDGRATIMITANEREPFRAQTIEKPGSERRSPNRYLIDLTQWRRVAMERTLDLFPPAEPKTPFVENGTLVIVGGGGMPKDLMQQFVDLAGGLENAKLVYVPCSEQNELSSTQRTVQSWQKMGVQHATFIHTKDRRQANDDEAFLAPLKDATGIWFGGGRQWNFADSYYGTTAHKLMKEVLQRGGVIGGSSAGASIQARYLARATPISNFDIMAPGYERGGLGFISGVAIDQHFSQRGRQKDMTQLVNRYPQMLGIGLDEATAIIVKKSTAEVVGRGKAHFYDRNLPVYPDKPDYVALPAGSSYDLAERSVIKDTTVEGARLESLTELVFTEGPAYHADGSVFFTDIANNRIMRLMPGAADAEVFLQPSGRANGLMFDSQGQLIACEGNERGGQGGRRVTSIDVVTKKRTVLADHYQGKRFNSPNDLCIDKKGRIYFTDPYYGPDRDQLELEEEAVYRVDPANGEVVRILGSEHIARPNGIALSKDQKTLFVVDNHPLKPVRKLWAFELDEEGLLAATGTVRELHDFGAGRGGDGMCIDQNDNLYVTAGANRPYTNQNTDNLAGVYVFSPQGKLLRIIESSEDMITNCCFGGPELQTLYVTAGKTLWNIRLKTTGRLVWPATESAE